MSREIKFRGKDIRGKWHYGYFYKAKYHVNKLVLHSFITTPRPKEHNKPSVITMVIPETVGQYTGLKDKNGVEIYEGDIAKDSKGNYGEVFYDETTACFNIKRFYDASYDCPTFAFSEGTDDIEIIGNIHEGITS